AVGASRHRRHRARLAADRDQSQLELGLGRAAARPAGRGLLRTLKVAAQPSPGRDARHPTGTSMTEMLFYHLQGQPLERVLPTLLERSLERGWRVVVQSSSEERVEALDAQLWVFRDDSFLPHGTHKETSAPEQPILL